MAGIYDANIGAVPAGSVAWLALDANNTPTASPGGNATVAKPAPTVNCCPVFAPQGGIPDALMSLTGAPLKTICQPYPTK